MIDFRLLLNKFKLFLDKVRNYGFLRRCREVRDEFNEAMLVSQRLRFEREQRRRAALDDKQQP